MTPINQRLVEYNMFFSDSGLLSSLDTLTKNVDAEIDKMTVLLGHLIHSFFLAYPDIKTLMYPLPLSKYQPEVLDEVHLPKNIAENPNASIAFKLSRAILPISKISYHMRFSFAAEILVSTKDLLSTTDAPYREDTISTDGTTPLQMQVCDKIIDALLTTEGIYELGCDVALRKLAKAITRIPESIRRLVFERLTMVGSNLKIEGGFNNSLETSTTLFITRSLSKNFLLNTNGTSHPIHEIYRRRLKNIRETIIHEFNEKNPNNRLVPVTLYAQKNNFL